jgi:hypothetical protein
MTGAAEFAIAAGWRAVTVGAGRADAPRSMRFGAAGCRAILRCPAVAAGSGEMTRKPFEDELKPRDAVVGRAAARHAVIAAGKHRKLDRHATRALNSRCACSNGTGGSDLPVHVRVTQADGHQAWSSPIYLIS